MPDYRWGIFLAEPEQDRKIPCGDSSASRPWQECPGEFRNASAAHHRDPGRHRAGQRRAAAPALRTRPACTTAATCSRSTSRRGGTCGRWSTCCTPLRPRRPRGGRRTARAPLRRLRQAAHPDHVQRADRRLAVVLHVHDVHRPRRQVPAAGAGRERLSIRSRGRRASCSPRRRTTCSSARPEDPNEDARAQGGIDLPTVQRYVNFWYSSSLDLFGGRDLVQRGGLLRRGLKGRATRARSSRTTRRDARATTPWTLSRTAVESHARCRCATR